MIRFRQVGGLVRRAMTIFIRKFFKPGHDRDGKNHIYSGMQWRNEFAGTRDESGLAGLRLRTVWNVCQGPAYDVRRTGPADNVLIAIRTHRGLGRLELAGRTLDLAPGTFVVVRNLSLRRYHCAARVWGFWWFEFVAHGSLPCGLEEVIGAPLQRPAEAAAVGAIMRALRSPDPARRMHASSGLGWLMTGWLARRANPPADKAVSWARRDTIERVIQEMHTRLDGRWTIPEMAASAGLCERLFRDVFARVTGLSPKLFYGRLRLDAAREHLQLGQGRIKELADQLGFASPFHLSREFKRRFGVSPSSLLRRHRPACLPAACRRTTAARWPSEVEDA
jgi:AraC-like DNA-binding protein